MQHIDPELLKRYHAGNCTAEEQKTVETWLSQNDNFFEKDNEFAAVTDNSLEKELWNRIRQEIPRPAKTVRMFRWMAVAASAACIALIFLLSKDLFHQPSNNELEAEFVAAQKDYKTYTTQAGQRSTLLLSDSTVVYVMGGSTVRFPVTFDGDRRDILLDSGEIFLKVTHNPEQPFIVHSSGTQVRVLGTQFDVRNTKQDNDIHVTLKEGKIQFSASNNANRILKPGEELVFSKTSGLITRVDKVRDVNLVDGWTEGRLSFDRQPLREVFLQLEAFYGVQFESSKNINLDMPLTATIDNESLSEVLSVMRFSTGLKFTPDGSTIRVAGR